SITPNVFAFSNLCQNPSKLSFSAGTFSMAKSAQSADLDVLFAWAVPGQKYYFADSDGSNISSPHTQFAITDFREDASNYYVDPDIGNVLPPPTCNNHSCPCYTPYQASSVKQFNSGP